MLSERQKRFLVLCDRKRLKHVDIHDYNQMFHAVVFSLFESYLLAEKEHDKTEAAWLIFSFKDELKKKIKLWHLIEDKEEFTFLVKRKMNRKQEVTKNNQKRRHEKRDDFALTQNQWKEVVKYFDYKCAYCGDEGKLTYDHFYPFSKGGDFMKGNIIPACKSCNSSKHNKLFEEWYPVQDFYSIKREYKINRYIESNKQLALF